MEATDHAHQKESLFSIDERLSHFKEGHPRRSPHTSSSTSIKMIKVKILSSHAK